MDLCCQIKFCCINFCNWLFFTIEKNKLKVSSKRDNSIAYRWLSCIYKILYFDYEKTNGILLFFVISNLTYGRKWRGTKEPLRQSERGGRKSWLKTQHSENEDHGIRSHHFMANRWGNSGNSDRLFFWAPRSLQMVSASMKLKDLCSLEEKLWQT